MFLALVPYLMGALSVAMASLVWRAVLALGVGFVTYKGIDIALGAVKAKAMTGLLAIPGELASFLGFLWVDKAISVVFSAYVAALTIKAIGGAVKKAVLK